MIHLITLSGNSDRFISLGYNHKALLDIDGKTSLEVFINEWEDFNEYDTIFLCRNEDLEITNLKNNILKCCPNANIFGIDRNTNGPVFSISKIFEHIPDGESILITYIDSIQRESIKNIKATFKDCDGGLLVHDLQHPHWRGNKYYCLVKHDDDNNCLEVIEKYNFNNLDFRNAKGCSGSSGSYYVKDTALMKKYFSKLMEEKRTVNEEYYVTQIFQDMIADGLKVKAMYSPYITLGTPEEVEDFLFWKRWFK